MEGHPRRSTTSKCKQRPRRISRVIVYRGFDYLGRHLAAFDERLNVLHGLRRKELLARLPADARRHMLDDDEPAIVLQGVSHFRIDHFRANGSPLQLDLLVLKSTQ